MNQVQLRRLNRLKDRVTKCHKKMIQLLLMRARFMIHLPDTHVADCRDQFSQAALIKL